MSFGDRPASGIRRSRVVAYVLVLPLSLLMMLGVFRVIGGLKNA
jgi:hypothetical protein